MSKKQLMIWFDDKGNMLADAQSFTDMQRYATQIISPFYTYKFEEAKDFDDELEFVKIQDYRRGNARVYLKSVVSNRTYSMFIDNFNEVILAHRFTNNRIAGTFHFSKKGAAQTIILVLPKKP